jgi:hypothetical protein
MISARGTEKLTTWSMDMLRPLEHVVERARACGTLRGKRPG